MAVASQPIEVYIRIDRPAGASHLPDRPNRNGSYEDRVMASKALPSPEVLRQLLRYEPDTGKLFWKHRAPDLFRETPARTPAHAAGLWNSRYAGTQALAAVVGTDGHLGGAIFGQMVRSHRVIWALCTGAWPTNQIDHINGNPADNRIANLRDVSASVNALNRRREERNRSGKTGVYWHKGKQRWVAIIKVQGVPFELGRFQTFEEACAARSAGEKLVGVGPNHGRALGETLMRQKAKGLIGAT